MIGEEVLKARKLLRTPRAAAVAGILFAVLYGGGLFLIRTSIPSTQTNNQTWLETNSNTVALALNMVPYSGIAFLWFIGVIRDHFGDLEDRFFSTVFLGSGLLFLALTFMAAALAGGLLSSYALESAAPGNTSVYIYSRGVIYQLINVYALRMEGVFMISLGTIWWRTGLMPRGWTILTYTLALVVLVTINLSLWVTLVFPGWVLVISVTILIQNLNKQSQTVSEA